MAGTSPEVTSYPVKAIELGVRWLHGSFQGNGGSDPATTQVRGNWFTVVHQGSGQWRVTLTAPPVVAALGTSSNNTGLIVEPFGWITSESETAGTAPVKYCNVQCTRVITTGKFDIFVYDIVGAALYDVTTADRINFSLAWKSTSFTP